MSNVIKTVIMVDDLSKVFIMDEIRSMIKGKASRKILIDISYAYLYRAQKLRDCGGVQEC